MCGLGTCSNCSNIKAQQNVHINYGGSLANRQGYTSSLAQAAAQTTQTINGQLFNINAADYSLWSTELTWKDKIAVEWKLWQEGKLDTESLKGYIKWCMGKKYIDNLDYLEYLFKINQIIEQCVYDL